MNAAEIVAIDPTPARSNEQLIEVLRSRLLGQSFLFDEPETYQAGVEDTLAELAAAIADGPHTRLPRSGC